MPYDGLNVLIKALENDGGLESHLIENTLFFRSDIVARQAEEMLTMVHDGKLPVRFATGKSIYITDDGYTHTRLFTNRTEATHICRTDDIYTSIRPGIRIKVDKDGNHWVRHTIKAFKGELVSGGRKSTIKNYMISHIWGNTADPYFFSALWNLALTPMHCSFILDKPDSHHQQIKGIKELYKAICWELYRPDQLMEIEFPEIPERQYLEQARYYIDNCLLNFIPASGNNDSANIRP